MVPELELNDGTTIPQLGFGTLQIPESRQPSPAEIDEAAGILGEAFADRLPALRHGPELRQRGGRRAGGG